MIKKTPWTNEELLILKQYYPLEGREAAKRIKGRTVQSASRKASDLKLKYTGTVVDIKGTSTLTEEESKVLKYIGGAESKKRTVTEISNLIDRSPENVNKILQVLRDKHYSVSTANETGLITLYREPKTGHRVDIDVNKYFGSTREVVFGATSDWHYANVHCREELIKFMYDVFKKEGVSLVFMGGNMIDGELYFNRYELVANGIEGQTQYIINHAPQIEGITTYFITANHHETWGANNVGLNYGNKLEDDMHRAGRKDWVYLSHIEGDIGFKTKEGECVVRIMHPQGGTAYATSYQPQKITESFQGGEKPHILLIAHYHKLSYFMVRNVHTIQTGCLEDQTGFMRSRHIDAHLGFWIIRATLAPDGTVLKFTPTLYPFFDRKIYQINRDFQVQSLEVTEKLTPKVKIF